MGRQAMKAGKESDKPLVVIIMGSVADLEHAQEIATSCTEFGIEVCMHVASAHRTPEHALGLLRRYDQPGRSKVFITVAGRSNALSGLACAQVGAPVLACPPASEAFGGADIYSSVRMPVGVAPALLLEPRNAALFAAKILAMTHPAIARGVAQYQQQYRNKVLTDDARLQQGVPGTSSRKGGR